MKPRLTIVIPTINRASLLTRAIKSALAQTSSDIEIIVSDNGSTDNTPGVIAQYAGRGLRTFRHVATMSVSKHSEFLMQQVRTEFLVALSDDDFLEPPFAAEVLALFDRRPDLSFIYTGCAVHYEDLQVPALVGPEVETGAEFLAAHYSGRREVSWCACVTRARDIAELMPLPEGFVLGDMFYWTKLAFRGPVGCIPRILSHYILLRSQNDNMSHGTSPIVWAQESRYLAEEIIRRSRTAGATQKYLARFETESRSHVARSVANQFVWTHIRGMGPVPLLGCLFQCAPYLGLSPLAWSRATAGVLLPRSILKALLLRAALKMAHARRAQVDKTTHDEVGFRVSHV